jgi:nitrile hydratase
MTSVHDLGGMHGFGPVLSIEDSALFHAAWEARVFGIVRALIYNRAFTADEFKEAVERMDPAAYLGAAYYERWTDALERLCVEKGLL